ncbi:hypothetical protein [Viscerimonas tarda]
MKKLLFIFLFTLSCFSVFAQQKTEEQKLAEFVGKINAFNNLYPQEKVYLHFDNTGYYKGEAIWFKAYVVTSENNTLSPLSKVLYVDLLTAEGDVLEAKKIKIEDGQASGGFVLKEDYYSGFLQVRAYTRCMLNFGEHVMFNRVFPVYDQPQKAGDYAAKKMSVRGKEINRENIRKSEGAKPKDVNLSFFPEGGNLIAGIGNRVAFKATNKEGAAIEVTGKVYNSKGEEITSFSSLHQGMGSFELYPDGNKYTAKLSYEGKEQSFELPHSLSSGYSLRVDNLHPASISVQVEKTANEPTQALGITFACRGKVYAFKSFGTGSEGRFAMRIPKENLPAGVIQITVFTPRGEVVAQRQIFVNPANQSRPIKATKINSSFEPYSPIDIAFEIKDAANNPVETTFSLSVRDADTDTGNNYTDNILYNTLLSSDLKGYIEDPAYYFEADDNKHKIALDLLMLTQGWTRYSWKQMAGTAPFEVKYGIEKSLMIEGKALSPITVKPQENIDVTMWMTSPYGSSQRGKCTTDKDGKFNFALDDIKGTWDLSLLAKKKSKPYVSRITLDRNIDFTPLAYNYYETHLFAKKEKKVETESPQKKEELTPEIRELVYAKNRFDDKQEEITMSYVLPEVTVKGKVNPRKAFMERELKYATVVYDVIKEIDSYRDAGGSESSDVLEFLERTDLHFKPSIGDSSYRYKGRGVVFLIDGFPAGITGGFGSPYPRSVSETGIDEIEHILIQEFSSEAVTIQIILNEDGRSRREPRGTRQTKYQGFSQALEFYHPDYSIARLPDEKDFRRTLYWNPDVKTDKAGKATISFYNNGSCKELNISAEGLTSEGAPVVY